MQEFAQLTGGENVGQSFDLVILCFHVNTGTQQASLDSQLPMVVRKRI
jgi:hypothetical protein